MTTPDLLPCPFCGGKAEYDNADTYSGGQWIACVECGAKVHSGYYANPDCHAQWNRRAPVAPTSSPAPAPSGPSLDPQWLFNCAKFWYDTGIRDGANKWKIGLLLLAARAESLLKESPVVKPHAHEPAPAPAAGPAERKVVSYFPALYFTLYPMLGKIAYARGYCLAVHGSIGRDFDLIAVPWTDEAVEPMVLLEAMQEKTAGLIQAVTAGTEKPHGRKAWILELSAGAYLDISFTPRAPALPKGEAPKRLRCSHCGKAVSSLVPSDTLVSAWIECPACAKVTGGRETEAPPSSPSPDQDWPPPPEVELVSRLQGMLTRVGFSSNPQDYQKVLLEVKTILAKETGGGEPSSPSLPKRLKDIPSMPNEVLMDLLDAVVAEAGSRQLISVKGGGEPQTEPGAVDG